MRRPTTVVALLALVGSILTGSLLTGGVSTAEAATPDSRFPAVPLSVVSYNIHHAQGADGVLDLQRIAGVLRDSKAEVIALQEVDNHWGERSENADQASDLARMLHMHVVYGANLDLDPAAPGEPRRQYGTAILSKYPILWSSNTLLQLFPNGEQRGLLQAIVMVRGVPVRVMGTHLQHNNSAERLAQIAAIRDLAGPVPWPTVLMGDMNADPETAEYQQLTQRFSDVWAKVGDGPGYTFDSDDPQGRIDYVLTSGGVTPKAAEVLQTQASDHMPVKAQLKVSLWPAGIGWVREHAGAARVATA